MLEIKLLKSTSELIEIADSWNTLWEESDSTSALTRCRPLAIWLEHFAADREFRAVTVWESNQLVAAIPLIVGKKKGLKVAELPNNSWSISGDLLLSENCNQSQTLDALIKGLNQINTLAIWLDWIRVDQLKWWMLQEKLAQRFQAAYTKTRFAISEIHTPESFEQYEQALSKNHRKKTKRAIRGLQQSGNVETTAYSSQELNHHLDEAFDLEHRSWKGQNGSSILSEPRIETYFRQLAQQLDQEGLLALEFLRFDGKAIAFDLGYLAKGTRGSHKISFDKEFAKYSPGQVLVAKQIENASASENVFNFDSIGPTTDAIQKWTDESYNVGRIFLSNSRWTSRLTVGAMGQLAKLLNKLKSPAIAKTYREPLSRESS